MKKLLYIAYSMLVATSLGCATEPPMTPAESIQVKPSKEPSQYGHEAQCLVIACMDFRLPDETEQFLQKRDLLDKYDYISWPGASLSVGDEANPIMNEQMLNVIGLSKKLHSIKKVIFIDHRDCGAYKLKFGPEHAQDRSKETEIHKEHMQKVKKLLDDKFPDLEKEFLLLGLDGKVETIIPSKTQ